MFKAYCLASLLVLASAKHGYSQKIITHVTSLESLNLAAHIPENINAIKWMTSSHISYGESRESAVPLFKFDARGVPTPAGELPVGTEVQPLFIRLFNQAHFIGILATGQRATDKPLNPRIRDSIDPTQIVWIPGYFLRADGFLNSDQKLDNP